MPKKTKTPWPTKAVMDQIYEQHLWGGNEFDFYSGNGSHLSEITTPYLEVVRNFLYNHNHQLSVCDLGCGDFNVGQHLVNYTKTYTAIDIVDTLIERNKTLFPYDNLQFKCLNIVEDDLPQADCAIIRQVLQHLSNSEIASITSKLNNYKYVILTEHLPQGEFIANKDIITGQGIRLKHKSGVDLLKAPFNITVKRTTVLNDIILSPQKGRITTLLLEL